MLYKKTHRKYLRKFKNNSNIRLLYRSYNVYKGDVETYFVDYLVVSNPYIGSNKNNIYVRIINKGDGNEWSSDLVLIGELGPFKILGFVNNRLIISDILDYEELKNTWEKFV